jgi:hypothetical protein
MKRLIVFLIKLVGVLFIACGLIFAILAVSWNENNFIYGVVGIITLAFGIFIVTAKKGYLSDLRYGYFDEIVKKDLLRKRFRKDRD